MLLGSSSLWFQGHDVATAILEGRPEHIRTREEWSQTRENRLNEVDLELLEKLSPLHHLGPMGRDVVTRPLRNLSS